MFVCFCMFSFDLDMFRWGAAPLSAGPMIGFPFAPVAGCDCILRSIRQPGDSTLAPMSGWGAPAPHTPFFSCRPLGLPTRKNEGLHEGTCP